MELHVVVTLAPGYAREDASTASLIGAYTDAEVAESVRKCSMNRDARVVPVSLDAIPQGVRENAKLFNIVLPSE